MEMSRYIRGSHDSDYEDHPLVRSDTMHSSKNSRFEGTYCLHLQVQNVSQASNHKVRKRLLLASSFDAKKTEAVHYSYQITLRHIPGNSNIGDEMFLF
jgi:hypothetical protein